MTPPPAIPGLEVEPRQRACEGFRPPDKREVGKRLRALRLARGWRDREEAAWHLGVDAKSLKAWEGGRWLPGGGALTLLAYCYRVSETWLLWGE